ncbi:hypothetical protein [Streptomyces sp. NPDC000961]|uniref:hypothetical protein n=1 Tax=Streptomyces sp. NPDC000961 TaxID=3364541 RepID=UPI00368FC1E8
MIVVEVRRLGVVLVAGLALTGCMASPTESALEAARQTCTNLGYEDGSRSSDDDGSSGTSSWSNEKWAEITEDFNDEANRVARAAREDPRWDNLSNAITDIQRLMELQAKIEDQSLDQVDRDAAQAQKDAMQPQEILRSLDQECRKAMA